MTARLIACLHRSACGWLLSLRSWSIHLPRGRPGRRFRKGPVDVQEMGWCSCGAPCGQALPRRALLYVSKDGWTSATELMISDREERPVRAANSSFRTNWCQDIPKIPNHCPHANGRGSCHFPVICYCSAIVWWLWWYCLPYSCHNVYCDIFIAVSLSWGEVSIEAAIWSNYRRLFDNVSYFSLRL